MKFKKFLSMALAAAMALSLTVPASAAKPAKNTHPAASSEKTVTLKGEQSGTEFNYDKECWSTWQNVVFLGGANENSTDEEVSAWHLVYTDKKGVDNDLKSMKLTFDNGEVYEWNWDIGLSTNGSGNNPGWMVVAPASYGKINVANSFIVTTSSKNVQFNISGYYQAGSKPVDPDEPVDPDDGKVSAVFQITKYLNEFGTPGADFVFDIISVETGEIVGSMTSNEYGEAKTELSVAPGKYIIREQVNADVYMPVDDVYVTVDENGNATFDDTTFDGTITNYEWAAMTVDTPVVMQKYDEMWHTPIYEYSTEDTRVSRVESDLPDYITGDTFANNGFTYLVINKAALEAAPATIRIAQSDPSNSFSPDIAPAHPWEKAIHAVYTLEIKDGKLVVTSNLPNFGFAVYGPNDDIEGNKDFNKNGLGPKDDGVYDEPTEDGYYVKSWPLPELGEDGTFRFYIHYKVGYTTATVTGCKSDADSLITRECERVYTGNDVAVTVKDGDTVVTDLTKLDPRKTYTVTVTANGETLATKDVTLTAGETETVTFDTLYLSAKGDTEYHCANSDCDLNKSSVEG